MSDPKDLQDRPPRPGARPGRGNRVLAFMQFAPLLVVFFFVTACSGSGGSSGDFFTGRRSNIFLKGFTGRVGDANFADPVTVSAWAPFTPGTNTNDNSSGRSTGITNNNNQVNDLLFDDVFAQLDISNGISARLDQILLEFTEVDGSPVIDFNVTPPTAVPGRFDYPIRSSLSLFATPLTSVGAPLSVLSGPIARTFVPINIFKSGIFEFLLEQPAVNRRPFLCRMTFTGFDILENPFRIVGFLIVNPVLQTNNRTLPGGGGATDRSGANPSP